MKKFLLVLLAALAIGCIASYVLIPGKLAVSSAAVMQTSENGTHRFILDKANWPKWWNYKTDSNTSSSKARLDSFVANGDVYTVTELFYKSAKIYIRHNQDLIETRLAIIPLQTDSTGIEWKYSVTTSNNPFTRIMQYRGARKVKENMDYVLSNLQAFLSKKENVYGIHIEQKSITDTLLVSAKSVSDSYPATIDIYALIRKIQAYIKTLGAVQTGNPIFNVTQLERANRFQLMCAVPVDKEVAGNDVFSFKRMVRGNFMVADVLGGDSSVHRAARNLTQYFEDYSRTTMAINFSMFITDRLYQPDTAKWITRLYYPVF